MSGLQIAGGVLPWQDPDGGQPGIIAPAGRFGIASQALTSNRIYYSRIRPWRNIALVNVAFCVTGFSATDDPIDISIHNSSLGRLASLGSTSGKLNATNGWKTAALSYTLQKGSTYYIGFVATSTAAILMADYGNALAYAPFGTSAGNVVFEQQAGTFPIPDPAVFSGSPSTTRAPIIALRET